MIHDIHGTVRANSNLISSGVGRLCYEHVLVRLLIFGLFFPSFFPSSSTSLFILYGRLPFSRMYLVLRCTYEYYFIRAWHLLVSSIEAFYFSLYCKQVIFQENELVSEHHQPVGSV